MEKELNRMSFIIMNQMLKAQATDFMHSLSCEEIRSQIRTVQTCTDIQIHKDVRKSWTGKKGSKSNKGIRVHID